LTGGDWREKLFWNLKDIEKSLIKKGTISSELIGIPLLEIRILWQQNKQGKGKSKAEKDLSLNDLVGFQQNGCMVCTVEAAKKDWKCLSILWEKFYKMGLCHRFLGQNALMIVNFNGQPTDSDCHYATTTPGKSHLCISSQLCHHPGCFYSS
jgi:hypothetical protein